MILLTVFNQRFFCDLIKKNKKFLKKIHFQNRALNLHQHASKIDEKKISDFVSSTPKQKIAYQLTKNSQYDKELKDFIAKFNIKHKNRISLLDFSNYTTELGELKNEPLKKQDIDLIKQFQKRKVDQKILKMRQNIREKRQYQPNRMNPYSIQNQLYGYDKQQEQEIEDEQQQQDDQLLFRDNQLIPDFGPYEQGPFTIQDSFVILFLHVRMNTKVTTLNRINSVKTLLFMGNGHGIISHAKGRGVDKIQSLQRTLFFLKKNLIALPRDPKCTFPLPITKKFQDYRLYLKPNPGFNAHGHPVIAFMLTLAGMDHCRFHVAHTGHNIYNVLKVFFKAVTNNTTPQQLAERQGFKVYRHQFIRPLTYVRTHVPVASQAKTRRFKRNIPTKLNPVF